MIMQKLSSETCQKVTKQQTGTSAKQEKTHEAKRQNVTEFVIFAVKMPLVSEFLAEMLTFC